MNKFLLFFVLTFTLASCDPQMVFDKFEPTENGMWAWNDVKTFEAEIDDVTQAFNVYLNVRHTKEYPKSNLFIFVKLESPNGGILRDTVEIQIADEHGRWLGNGFGNIKFVRRLFRGNVHFASPGTYKFTLEQGMRIEKVPVTDVGVRIEKYQPL